MITFPVSGSITESSLYMVLIIMNYIYQIIVEKRSIYILKKYIIIGMFIKNAKLEVGMDGGIPCLVKTYHIYAIIVNIKKN